MSNVTQLPNKKRVPKVAREVAEAEFERLCEAHRVEHDTAEMTDAEATEWRDDIRAPIVREIMSGTLIVGEDGNPTYTVPGTAKGLTFHGPTGATLMALETYAGGKNIANLVAAMADMTHTDRGEFGKMAARDVQACARVAKLFLADR
jgi:hypothetical protein